MPEPIMVAPMPRPADPSATKPIYIVRVDDPEVRGKIKYYRVQKIDRHPTHLTISGFELTKAQAEQLRENPSALEVAEQREVNIEIPWQRVISTENITYKKKAHGEQK
jgi:hypothetical protein